MDRKKIQELLDNYFYDKGLKSYHGRKELNVDDLEYIIFMLSNGNDSNFADNFPLNSGKYVDIKYYTKEQNLLDKRNKEIVQLMRENGFSVIDNGTDIPAELDADIWGISMEFYYESFI